MGADLGDVFELDSVVLLSNILVARDILSRQKCSYNITGILD